MAFPTAFAAVILLGHVVCALRAPRETGQLLVGYWGQNSGSQGNGAANNEKALKEVCETTKYNVLAISFLHVFFDPGNKDDMPSLNFAFHCTSPVSSDYPSLLRCPQIEEGINECQKLGKRVLLSLGGARGDGTLDSSKRARTLANRLYKLFLGGSGLEKLRPFGNATLDGIDLDIEEGRYNNYPEFITILRNLTDADQNKTYLITGAPKCPYPDHFLGPVYEGTGLQETGHYFDHLYIQFYDNYCHTGNLEFFLKSLKQWLTFANKTKPGPSIFIGIPAALGAASSPQYYRPPEQLKAVYEKIKDLPDVGGIMLWDISWDQNNVIDGKRYSEYAFETLKQKPATPTPKITMPTTVATTAVHIPTTSTTPPKTTPGPFSCNNIANGIYSDPTDCANFVICDAYRKYTFSCALGLRFNSKTMSCDWAHIVSC